MKIYPVSKDRKDEIASEWFAYYKEFKRIKPLRLVKVYGPCYLALDLFILRGNEFYSPIYELGSVFEEESNLIYWTAYTQNLKDKINSDLWIEINNSANLAENHVAFKEQSLINIEGDIEYKSVVKALEFVLDKGITYTRIGIPYYQLEFLIRLSALFKEQYKEIADSSFESCIARAELLPEKPLLFFKREKSKWIESLKFEYENPEVILRRYETSLKRLQKKYKFELFKIL